MRASSEQYLTSKVSHTVAQSNPDIKWIICFEVNQYHINIIRAKKGFDQSKS